MRKIPHRQKTELGIIKINEMPAARLMGRDVLTSRGPYTAKIASKIYVGQSPMLGKGFAEMPPPCRLFLVVCALIAPTSIGLSISAVGKYVGPRPY